MNSKAQIASLDFILSVVLVVVALGLIMQTIEVNQYTMKEMEINNELERIGETAADILVSHPDVTCDVYNQGGTIKIAELQNCVMKKYVPSLTKSLLGINNDYDCKIEGITINQGNPCANTAPNNKQIYSADRLIMSWNPAGNVLTKKQIIKCMNGHGCGQFQPTVMTLKIWKVS